MDATACFRHPDRPSRIVCQRCDRPICPECMVQGSVGFHCPECVASQPKVTTKPLKTVKVQPTRITSMVIAGINAVVWLAILVTGFGNSKLIDWLALTPLGACPTGDGRVLVTDAAGCAASNMEWVPGVMTGAVWQPITSAFTHVQPWHILFNMMALFILGPQLEAVLRRSRFLALYAFSALTASAVVMLFSAPFQATLGASGAIFGLMGAFLIVALKRKADLRGILIWLGLNAVFTFTVPNVSWEGHLGGLLGGALFAWVILSIPWQRRKWQWWILGGMIALAVVLIVAVGMIRMATGWS